jgi:hypothetical protein
MLFQLLSRVLVTHRTPSTISPSHFGKSVFALLRTLYALLVCFETPNPDPRCQRSTDPILSGISLSGNRRMKGSEALPFQNPECRYAMPRVVLHAVSVGPIATRTRYSSMFLSTLKTPKCRVPTPRDLVPPVPPMIDGSD